MPLVGVRSALRILRQEKPHWSLGDLAHELGVTRERVRQLLVQEGLPTKRRRPIDVIDEGLARIATPESPARAQVTHEDTAGDAGIDLPVTRVVSGSADNG